MADKNGSPTATRKDSSDVDDGAPLQELDATPMDSPPATSALPVPPTFSSQAPVAPPAVVDTKALDDRLLSENGINILLTRLKQSLASARDFAAFLKERSGLEDKHAQGLRKLARTHHESARGQEMRQGTFSRNYLEIARSQERMAESGLTFAQALLQMHEELTELTVNIEKGRKQWKHEGLDNEKKVKDAESAMDKAKSRYDSLAEQYDKVKTGEGGGKIFGIKGPKSAEQREADLRDKVDNADAEYSSKVDAAQATRQNNLSTLRPKAVRALQELIRECDLALSLHLQKFAATNERLLVANGIAISPIKDASETANGASSMRELIQSIDNDRDFHTFVLSHPVPAPPPPIQYRKHPTLAPAQVAKPPQPTQPVASQTPIAAAAPPSTSSFSVQSPPAAASQPAPPSSASGPRGSDGPPPSYQGSPRQGDPERGFRGPPPSGPQGLGGPPNGFGGPQGGRPRGASNAGPNGPGGGPPRIGTPDRAPTLPQLGGLSPSASQPPPQQFRPNDGPPVPRGEPPGPGPQRGANGAPLPSYNPVFGMTLEALFRRDESAVPLVVFQCIQAVDLFGLEVEGIYRLSGNSAHINALKAQFDHDATHVDFRNPASFHHDINSVAGLLKQFFRELPDPLLTKEHYQEFIDAARLDDPTLRRDSLHAVINALPDPNYATLRALVLHLNRVHEKESRNRMSINNLSLVFAPTLMGQHAGAIADAGLQARVIDTILHNTYQIFDED